VRGSTFERNGPAGFDAGISGFVTSRLLVEDRSFTVTRSRFRHNEGRALDVSTSPGGTVRIARSIFGRTVDGGALRARAGEGGNIEIANCGLFANEGSFGGGLNASTSQAGAIDVGACVFLENTASFGGAIIASTSESRVLRITHCLAARNGASLGGGLSLRTGEGGLLEVINCTVFENDGGGVDMSEGAPGSLGLEPAPGPRLAVHRRGGERIGFRRPST